MKIQQLDDDVYIADQINITDMNGLRELGIQSVINNRPDNEESAEKNTEQNSEKNSQPLSEELSTYAAAINIDYYYLPVISGNYPVNTIREFTELLNKAKRPVLVFCRTGNRSVKLWALSQTPKFGHSYVFTKAKGIGFDIS